MSALGGKRTLAQNAATYSQRPFGRADPSWWSRAMSDSDFDAVVAASGRWMQAWMAQERATLDAFLGPDFALIISTVPTKPFERSDWLETAVTSYVCTRFAYEGVHCRSISDDVVAMSAIADFDATIGGVDRSGPDFLH